jgi:hypothetical protein
MLAICLVVPRFRFQSFGGSSKVELFVLGRYPVVLPSYWARCGSTMMIPRTRSESDRYYCRCDREEVGWNQRKVHDDEISRIQIPRLYIYQQLSSTLGVKVLNECCCCPRPVRRFPREKTSEMETPLTPEMVVRPFSYMSRCGLLTEPEPRMRQLRVDSAKVPLREE